MLIIFTGNGKGKTTAALGQAMRAIGNGSKVLMVQFIKGPWKSGEHSSAERLSPNFKIVKKGKGFVGIGNDTLPIEVHVKAAHEGLRFALKEIKSGTWNIVILDEIWNALSLGLLSSEEVDAFIIEALPALDHLIMTGRSCPSQFIQKADIVTEMLEIKHPFAHGVQATAGVEF
jgi:cob(I)alamin adenosyltransferase